MLISLYGRFISRWIIFRDLKYIDRFKFIYHRVNFTYKKLFITLIWDLNKDREEKKKVLILAEHLKITKNWICILQELFKVFIIWINSKIYWKNYVSDYLITLKKSVFWNLWKIMFYAIKKGVKHRYNKRNITTSLYGLFGL